MLARLSQHTAWELFALHTQCDLPLLDTLGRQGETLSLTHNTCRQDVTNLGKSVQNECEIEHGVQCFSHFRRIYRIRRLTESRWSRSLRSCCLNASSLERGRELISDLSASALSCPPPPSPTSWDCASCSSYIQHWRKGHQTSLHYRKKCASDLLQKQSFPALWLTPPFDPSRFSPAYPLPPRLTHPLPSASSDSPARFS